MTWTVGKLHVAKSCKTRKCLGIIFDGQQCHAGEVGKKKGNKLVIVISRGPGATYRKVRENELVSPKEYFSNTFPENSAFSLHYQKFIANRYGAEYYIKKYQSERKFQQASKILQ